MQLTRLCGTAALCSVLWFPSAARGDGEITLRGAYYKERSTRVQQPMVDGRFDIGDNTELRAHVLLDAITSASGASGSVGSPFTELRTELGLSFMTQTGMFRFGGSGRYSTEPDYKSVFGGVRTELDLAKRNTTLGLAFNIGRDRLTNAGSQAGIGPVVSGNLRTLMGSASVSQVLSQLVLVGATYDLIYLDGFQENPYRAVVAGGTLEMERVPETRVRHAFAANVRGFLPATRTTVYAAYRAYLDDWGVVAHTPEVRVIQEIKPGLEVHLRYRFYRQTRADFFKTIYDSNDPVDEPYLTDDVKLSSFDGHTYGVKIDALLGALGLRGRGANFRVDATVEYVKQNNRYGNAIVAQAGITVPFEY